MEHIVKREKGRLKDVPPGMLRLSSCRGTVQYYYCMPGKEKNGTYILKEQIKLIRSLAQKSYDEKIVRLAGKRLAQYQKLSGSYTDDEIEKIYLREHPERQKMIDPVEPTWQQLLEKWYAEEY